MLAAANATLALRNRATAGAVAVSLRAYSSSTPSTSYIATNVGASVLQDRRGANPTAATAIRQQRRYFAADTVYKFGVSPESIKTVEATLPLVGKAGTDFTQHFYRRMFTAHPELMNVFNQTNQLLGKQPKKLLKTVALAAQTAIDTGELPGELIEGIAQKHAALGLGKESYDVVGQHLLGTIEDLLTDDPTVLGAWGELYGDIASVFTTREKEIADEAIKTPGSWFGRREFELAEKERLSRLITRFEFKPVDGKPTPAFTPGAFTTVWADVGEEEGPYGIFTEQPRHYTLAMPRDGDFSRGMSISVKKQGLVSRLLHSAEVGSKWDLGAPFGCFNTTGVEKLWNDDVDLPIIFLSAGVGITPVLSMLENIYTTRPATWLHATKNGDVHAYRERLRKIAAVRSGEMKRRVWYAAPLETDGEPGEGKSFNLAKYHYKGRMNLMEEEVKYEEDLLHLDDPNARYFLCGPPGFMTDQVESLKRLGVTEDRIHSEGF